jgi:hypothetical protein
MNRGVPLFGVVFAAVLFLQPFTTHLPLILVPGPTATLVPTIPHTPTRTPTRTPVLTRSATPTRTATATPSLTPTQTDTPTPTATSTADLIVLGNHSTYTNTIGARYIVGEVKNNGDSNARFVKVTADVFNAQGQLIATDFAYAQRDVINPDSESCFKILLINDPVGFDHYQLNIEGDVTTEPVRPLSLFNINDGPNTLSYELIGQVLNEGAESLEFVKIIGTLYDSSNMVIGCDFTYANLDTLAPGAVSSWSLIFFGVERDRISLYALIPD